MGTPEDVAAEKYFTPPEESGLQCALNLAAKSYPGIPWSIPTEWAEQLTKEHNLEDKMACGPGDMTGEAHALFYHNGEVIRLKRDWMKHYQLFHGDWKPDPHWTGD